MTGLRWNTDSFHLHYKHEYLVMAVFPAALKIIKMGVCAIIAHALCAQLLHYAQKRGRLVTPVRHLHRSDVPIGNPSI